MTLRGRTKSSSTMDTRASPTASNSSRTSRSRLTASPRQLSSTIRHRGRSQVMEAEGAVKLEPGAGRRVECRKLGTSGSSFVELHERKDVLVCFVFSFTSVHIASAHRCSIALAHRVVPDLYTLLCMLVSHACQFVTIPVDGRGSIRSG